MKNGFTLVELIAVITIIGVITLIITPIVSNMIDESKMNTGKISTKDVIEKAKTYYMDALNDSNKKATLDGSTNVLSLLNLKTNIPDSGIINITSQGDIGVALKYGNYCYKKYYNDDEIFVSTGACTL